MGLGLEQGRRVQTKSVLQQNTFCGKIVSLSSRRHLLRRKIKQCEGQVHAHLCSAVSSHPLHILHNTASWSKVLPAMDSRADSLCIFSWPSCLLPGPTSVETPKQLCPSISCGILSKFLTFLTSPMVQLESGSADRGCSQTLCPNMWQAAYWAPYRVSSSPEPMNSYFMWQKGPCWCN